MIKQTSPTTNTIRLLGIDPGLRRTGWGIIDKKQGAFVYVSSGKITTSGRNLAERLTEIFNSVQKIIADYAPTSAAIEHTYVNINFSTSLDLAHARAAALVACSQAGVGLMEYAAKTIKKHITGNGNADKIAVAKMVKFYLPTCELTSHDEADALAIAICHACHIR